jgi:pantoate--beta-alanine ligase
MQIITTVKEIQSVITALKTDGKSIGFVPTMGALHSGHLSLIKEAKKTNNIVVCSVFVNPTQFNNKTDLKKYPRNLDQDAGLLSTVKCDIIFAPSVGQIYPKGLETKVEMNYGGLDTRMEGEFRPGHFAGMVQVVNRLLNIVTPNHLYMGQKDFQQFTIVARLIAQLKIKTKLVVCPIKREKNGLAMSSRNERLSADLRDRAKIIFKTLKSAEKKLNTKSIREIEAEAMKSLALQDFKPEYFSIVDGKTLKPVKDITKHKYIVACVATWAGNVRLIDNMIYKND